MTAKLLALATAAILSVSALACESLFPKCEQGDNCAPVAPDYPRTLIGEQLDTACSAACVRLHALGCPEGAASITGDTCRRSCLRASDLRPLPLECWADAGTVAAARGCGALRCVP